MANCTGQLFDKLAWSADKALVTGRPIIFHHSQGFMCLVELVGPAPRVLKQLGSQSYIFGEISYGTGNCSWVQYLPNLHVVALGQTL